MTVNEFLREYENLTDFRRKLGLRKIIDNLVDHFDSKEIDNLVDHFDSKEVDNFLQRIAELEADDYFGPDGLDV